MVDIGVEINQYKVIEHIGRGGMADVWSARDSRLNRMVAIKTIAHGLSQDADPVSLFKQEAQTIAQMEHPHILPIYDFGEFHGSLYIVMRYVSGGSLDEILRRGPMALEEGLRLGQAVAQALDYAHSNNVIHLDLKPGNVLLDANRSPYLADFGLATSLDPEGKALNPGSGTLLYMAPEQMTAEIIDHRADIFSFCIVMFHLFTGQLPFEGASPLALRLLQLNDQLPDVHELNPDIPPQFCEILRHGTSIEPKDRPATLMEIVQDLRAVITPATGLGIASGSGDQLDDFGYDVDAVLDTLPHSIDAGLLEAVDIFSRARHHWAGGNGRFLLGVTHFMLMNGYYMNAEEHGLTLDLAGQQMLLRGALEYDHELEFWWERLDEENRRWVCLHAFRSGNAPARVRALRRVETLPDADPPQIPRLVAQMLQIETDEAARLAALQVLGTRAKIMKPHDEYSVQSEYQGRMLTTMTRMGIEIRTEVEWREIVFTPEIDLLIATIAMDRGMPRVSEAAARVIGRIRSTTAVRFIVQQQRGGRQGALRALALVRDETPNLPDIVSVQGRLYAWAANTVRRLFDNPWGLFFRFVAALVGGWIAMGLNVFLTFQRDPFFSESFFTPQMWGNTLAVGLMFGLFMGVMVIVAGEFFERLRGFWPWGVQLVVSALIGLVLGTAVWGQYSWMYLQINMSDLYWPLLLLGGAGIALGFLLTALFNLSAWIAAIVTAAATYFPIWYSWDYYQTQGSLDSDITPLIYYFSNPDGVYTVAIPMAIIIAIGGHFPRLWSFTNQILKHALRREASVQSSVPVVAVPGTSTIRFKDLEATSNAAQDNEKFSPMNVATEFDLQQGTPSRDSDVPESEPTARHVDMGAATEVDPGQTFAYSDQEPDPDEDDENRDK